MKETELYYPTRVGTKWVLDEEGRLVTPLVTKSEKKDDTFQVTVSLAMDIGNGPKDRGTLTVMVSSRGVARVAGDEKKDTPPWIWLNLAAPLGECWDTPFGRVAVGTPEDIETPAGKYIAIPVAQQQDDDPNVPLLRNNWIRGATTSWFAPGVGMVKQTSGKKQLVVLKSFTPVKD